tara:strand:- start:1061 stop:1969 length:909 start_codon:yes stop_codon:yes gene_type:complete
MKKILLSIAIITGMSSCSQDDNGEMAVQEFPNGTNYTISNVDSQNAYAQLKQNLQANGAIGIVAEVDHQQNAQSIGENLDYTKIIFFGNPNLGTPLMQKNQLAGLDLPQKILFYKDEGRNIILYNSVEYLSSRHDLNGVGTLDQISGALENLATGVSNEEVLTAENRTVDFKEGIITKQSTQNFNETYARLKNALNTNENISIIAELDHQANAASVDMDLRPTRIIIFGNPNLGTPLMQSEQTTGLDLPQKMLVWENGDGEVFISYNDPDFIAERHNIDDAQETLNTIGMALDNLSNAAAGN